MLKRQPILLQGAEMLVLFAILIAIDHGLSHGDAYSGLNPNPYWLPVLVMQAPSVTKTFLQWCS